MAQITQADSATIQKWIEQGIEFAADYGLRVLGALILFIVGSWLIRRLVRLLDSLMRRYEYEPSLQQFLVSLFSWSLKIVLVILVVSSLGVDVTTFAAVIAAAGLAVGLSLQGSLSNFAGGVLLMIFKPYKIGDLIEAQGVLGHVKVIEVFTTHLVTLDNKRVIVPNGPMANGNITNYTSEGMIRVDTVIGVAYGEDIKKTKEVLLEVLTAQEKVLKDPEPTVNVLELANSSVNFAVRPYCRPEHYWDVYFATYEGAKLALDKAGIEIPFPHRVMIQRND
jgi:small conductance mechanosensitive channel